MANSISEKRGKGSQIFACAGKIGYQMKVLIELNLYMCQPLDKSEE